MENHLGTLLHAPLIGAKREQFAPGLRVTFHAPYAIYDLPTEQDIVVVRVLHGSRDAIGIAEHGGFAPQP